MFDSIMRKLQDRSFLEQAISSTEEPENVVEDDQKTYNLSSTSP